MTTLPMVNFNEVPKPTPEEFQKMVQDADSNNIDAIKQLLKIMLAKSNFKLYEYQLTLLATFIASNQT